MPMTLAAVAVPMIMGAIGNQNSSNDKAAALGTQQTALQNIMGVNSPDAAQLRAILQKYASVGEVAPQMETLIQQDPSLLSSIQTDPRLVAAQNQALQTMQQIGAQGGLRPQDQAALAQVRAQAQQQEQGNRAAILQNMQQRGIGGSGAELAAALANSQSSANRASQGGLQVAGQASQNALNAIYGAGQLGGQIQGQQFNQKAQQATAQDAINRYNALNSQTVANQNTSAINSAQAANLANNQAIANANTGIANQQTLQNIGATQSAYDNALTKARAAAGQSGALTNQYNTNAAQTQATYGGIGQAAGQGITAIATSNAKNSSTKDAAAGAAIDAAGKVQPQSPDDNVTGYALPSFGNSLQASSF